MISKRIYIGHSNNLDARLKYHNSGYVKSTAKDKPWKIIAVEQVESKAEARWLELSLKRSRGKLMKWIKKNNIKS
jgi:putative endonuclease